jgi:DNA-binding SARP family transcriptional activator
MRVNVIGGVQATKDNGAIIDLQPKTQAALVVFVLSDAPIAANRLAEFLWSPDKPPEEPPRDVHKAAVDQISKLLQAKLITRIRGGLGGRQSYRSALTEDDYVDIHAFRKEVKRAENTPPRYVWNKCSAYRAALDLWADPPLMGLPETPAMNRLLRRVRNERLDAAEEWAVAMLQTGRYKELTLELPALVEANPEREFLLGHLMRALYLAGRPGEARDLYAELRRRLNTESGAEPCEELKILFEQILTGHPSLRPRPGPLSEMDLTSPVSKQDREMRMVHVSADPDGRAGRGGRGEPGDTLMHGLSTGASLHHREDTAMSGDRLDPAVLAKLDTGLPHIARIYDYTLGGKNNFAIDREAADEFVKKMPGILVTVRHSRAFLARAVRFLAAECGIRQFLDIGTGLPTANNTHEVAQSIAPECRIAYVDNDPMVLAHARALLTSSPQGKTTYIHADLRDTDMILDEARDILDFSHPVAVMLIGILHCIPDADDPCGIIQRLLAAVPPGSYLVLGHPASDIETAAAAAATADLNNRLTEPVTFRSRDQVAGFLNGVEVLEPGLVQYAHWRPEPDTRASGPVSAWCAVAHKR